VVIFWASLAFLLGLFIGVVVTLYTMGDRPGVGT
jgi:hypothetical protein